MRGGDRNDQRRKRFIILYVVFLIMADVILLLPLFISIPGLTSLQLGPFSYPDLLKLLGIFIMICALTYSFFVRIRGKK